jgi:hypothetical protein
MTNNTGQPWSEGTIIGLAIATFFVPLVGIIAGIIGLQDAAKKEQGGGLLIWGIVTLLGWLIYLNS